MNLPFLLFVLISAFLWAKLEIEIEGESGWAAALPTWRVEKHVILDWLYGSRPLTGYHLWCYVFMLFLFHLPFFWNVSWSLRGELTAIGGTLLFWVVEDFLWFVLNPHFGLKKFARQYVWWHKRWLLGLPVDYWVFGTLGLVLTLLS